MSTFKKTKVVMLPLPTNEKAPTHDYLFLYKPSNRLVKNGFVQHLYFLSDEEEIKEGDWYIHNQKGVGLRVQKCIGTNLPMDAKKIIATTDEFLSEQIMYYPDGCVIGGLESYKILPQPSQSFIEKFVEEYNKGNVITEVMVEYNEPITEIPKPYKPYSEVEHLDSTLKVSKDNTITIRKAKDSWSREEVIELLHKRMEYTFGGDYDKSTTDKWIEENL